MSWSATAGPGAAPTVINELAQRAADIEAGARGQFDAALRAAAGLWEHVGGDQSHLTATISGHVGEGDSATISVSLVTSTPIVPDEPLALKAGDAEDDEQPAIEAVVEAEPVA